MIYNWEYFLTLSANSQKRSPKKRPFFWAFLCFDVIVCFSENQYLIVVIYRIWRLFEIIMRDGETYPFYLIYSYLCRMNIQENIERIAAGLPEGVRLIAISKTKPVEDIEEAYAGGQRAFGENRPQEMASKYRLLPKDIEWHMIGQLQEKNVKYIAPFVTLIHSVDSLKLLVKIDREAAKYDRIINCLLEFHIAEESTKSGLTYEQAEEMMECEEYKMLKNVRVIGVMGIATYTENMEQVRQEFSQLRQRRR